VRRAEAALAHVAALEGPEQPLAPALLERAQSVRALAAAVEELPSHLGELYHLRARGLSYAELAEVLALPLGTVKSRLHELVKRLKQEVS
jgi:RNA polymerase sigma-70 factor (ECF subfamily)